MCERDDTLLVHEENNYLRDNLFILQQEEKIEIGTNSRTYTENVTYENATSSLQPNTNTTGTIILSLHTRYVPTYMKMFQGFR